MKFRQCDEYYLIKGYNDNVYVPKYTYDSRPFKYMAIDPDGSVKVFLEKPWQTAVGWVAQSTDPMGFVTLLAEFEDGESWEDTLVEVDPKTLEVVVFDDNDEEDTEDSIDK